MTRCPYCQSEGGTTVECSPTSCRFFPTGGEARENDPDAIHRLWDVTGTDEPRPSHPVWVWSSQHHDFGDT